MGHRTLVVFVGPRETGTQLADTLADYEVVVAPTTADGIDILEDIRTLECVITDHNPPAIDCFELLAAAPADVPVIVAPQNGSSKLATHCLQAGAATYVDPTTVEAGLSTLVSALERVISEQAIGDRRLEEFSRLVSHELRSPIQTAKSGIALANAECDSTYLDDVNETLTQLDELTSNVLEALDDSDSTVELEPVDLNAVVEDAWPTETVACLSMPEDLPTVLAERSRLYQLFENLFRNAIEHGSTSNPPHTDDADCDGVAVELEVTEPTGDGTICLAVSDDGVGIDVGRRKQVFEYGYTNSETGSGLGLAIVDEIVSTFDWEITITDSQQGGARFEICQITIV